MAKNNDNQVDKAARWFLWRVDQLIVQRKSWAWACVEFRELARGTKGASAISDEIGPSFEFASMDDCDSLAYFHLKCKDPHRLSLFATKLTMPSQLNGKVVPSPAILRVMFMRSI